MMKSDRKQDITRRQFIGSAVCGTTAAIGAGFLVPYWHSRADAAEPLAEAEKPLAEGDKPRCGTIGVGGIWKWKMDHDHVKPYLNVIAVCDVDKQHLEAG